MPEGVVERVNRRSRLWCVTINNYNEHEPGGILDFLRRLSIGCEWCCWQFERGENGTPHVQSAWYFANPVTFAGVRRKFKLGDGTYPHIDAARGSPSQCRDYCSKEETRDPDAPGPFEEHGRCPVQGQRTDIERFVELARDGAPVLQILESCPKQFCKYFKAYDRIRASVFSPRNTKTIVKWFWGPTGCGKSHAAREEGGDDVYWKSVSTKWWDMYEQQRVVILDDYRCDFSKFNDLLRLFDEYPLLIESKGGYIHFNSEMIIVTCPKKPEDMWGSRTAEDINQLLRRINEVREFTERE